MLADIMKMTGLLVKDFEVPDINFLRDGADFEITYSRKG
jgi:hypothetical protein